MSQEEPAEPGRFVFTQSWTMGFAPEQVYAVLAAVADYPTWWTEVRSARQVSDDSVELQIRSFLPHTLAIQLTREIEDPVAGLLRVSISGDLEGWSQWQVREGTIAEFAQDVVVGGALPRRVLGLAAPLLHANHAAMMRSGERGLRRQLQERAR